MKTNEKNINVVVVFCELDKKNLGTTEYGNNFSPTDTRSEVLAFYEKFVVNLTN